MAENGEKWQKIRQRICGCQSTQTAWILPPEQPHSAFRFEPAALPATFAVTLLAGGPAWGLIGRLPGHDPQGVSDQVNCPDQGRFLAGLPLPPRLYLSKSHPGAQSHRDISCKMLYRYITTFRQKSSEIPPGQENFSALRPRQTGDCPYSIQIPDCCLVRGYGR